MIKVVGIAGPTASGKTALSIELANILGGEIVSADSMAVYKKMNISTAKPDSFEQKKAVFHLIDIEDPCNDYNVGKFEEDSHKAINTILSQNKYAIICGGSGLYMKAACEGLGNKIPECNKDLRESLENIYKRKGLDFFCNYLENIDPEIIKTIDIKNPRRVKRMIEIYKSTGITPSNMLKKESKTSRPDYKIFAITMPREILIERINNRIDSMIKKGLIEEVESLKNKISNTAKQAIGYKEILAYINNESTKEEAIERLKISTRQFAKRQYTWFKKNKDIIWLDIYRKNTTEILDEIIKVIKNS